LSSSGLQPVNARYDRKSRVQLVGNGQTFDPKQLTRLTDDERRRPQQDR
jgi:hypothetical protein